ncbi:ATP-binding protein [Brachybacterium sp. UMB0905]|uniref:ATP-binding protein n=2 Tax=unclassified Brachybacterium TaxID=2623841 RepID=UPI0011AEF368|nr:ATP-binding protein [Brachybacterium sp. UMB0905]
MRRREDAVLTGTCALLAARLRLPVILVRGILLAGAALVPLGTLTMFAMWTPWPTWYGQLSLGAALVLGYVLLWWVTPDDAEQDRARALQESSAAVRGTPRAVGATSPGAGRLPAVLRWLGLALVVTIAMAAALLTVISDLARMLLPPTYQSFATEGQYLVVHWSVAVMAGAVMLGIAPLPDLDRQRWSGRTQEVPRAALSALGAAVVLLLLTLVYVALALLGTGPALVLLAVGPAILGVLATLLVPWGRRLWKGMREETAQRAVAQHHRETSAHLHDSVLQTLVLLQRAGMPEEDMRRLARQQERELRHWLYAADAESEDAPTDLRAAVEALSAQVEDAHGVAVDTVIVGDAQLEDVSPALLAALREALLNAVRHAGTGVGVFVEIREDAVEAFVRDRGPGFDPAAVPPDRLGVRESIIGRMERAGGSATVSAAPGGGTEVALHLPGGGR